MRQKLVFGPTLLLIFINNLSLCITDIKLVDNMLDWFLDVTIVVTVAVTFQQLYLPYAPWFAFDLNFKSDGFKPWWKKVFKFFPHRGWETGLNFTAHSEKCLWNLTVSIYLFFQKCVVYVWRVYLHMFQINNNNNNSQTFNICKTKPFRWRCCGNKFYNKNTRKEQRYWQIFHQHSDFIEPQSVISL